MVASADENSDLFWAIRGGGGNFGVVTSFLFQAHPVHTVCAGPMLWDLDQAADIMKWYREFIVQAPEEINGFFAFLTVPPGPPFPDAWSHNLNPPPTFRKQLRWSWDHAATRRRIRWRSGRWGGSRW